MKHNSIIKRCNLLRIPLELRDKRDGSWRFFFGKVWENLAINFGKAEKRSKRKQCMESRKKIFKGPGYSRVSKLMKDAASSRGS